MFHFPIGIDYAVRAMIGCLFIIGVFYVKGFAAKVLKSRGLVLLGEASYAMYLLHGPISSMLDIGLQRTGLSRVEENPVVFTFYVLLTVGLSIVAFLFFESPLRKAILRKWSSH
jgi:peptidoglycan/LPS O-acetylase OafA/YrhL